MKLKPNVIFFLQKDFQKLLLTMKLVILLSLVAVLDVSADVFSQSERISLSIKNAAIKEVFEEIEKRSDCTFFYNDGFKELNRHVNLNVSNCRLDDVLNRLFANSSLTYRTFNNKFIVIAPKIIVQVHTVTGKVIDKTTGEPLPGVNILIKGTTKGTVTNLDGKFSLDLPNLEVTLVFSFMGYQTQEVAVSGKTQVDVALEISTSKLEEVVVVGYGTQKRTDITGSISSVPTARLEKIPVTNIMHALEGSVAGLNITQTSSVPGSAANALIRGSNSINASTTPFIVVDGIPFSLTGGSLNDINPNDIADIQVLKDASAVAIYGTRGSNGVILITTKRGNTGKPEIRYNGYVGFDHMSNILKPRSGQEYVEKYAEYMKQMKQTQTNPVPNAAELPNYNAGKTTDWLKEVTQQAIMQDHNLSLSGGTKDLKYFVSGDYLKQVGVVKGYQYHRASFRANLDVNVTNYLTMGTSLFFSSNNSDGGRVNLLNATAMSPYGQEYDAFGNYNIYPMYPELLFANPLIGLYVDRIDRSKDLNGNMYAELNPGFIKGLKYRINIGYSYVPTRYSDYTGRNANNTIGAANINNSETNNWIVENIISYTREFGKHHLDFTGLYSAQEKNYFYSNSYATGFINDQLSYDNLSAGATQSAGSSANKSTYLSQMGRINYSYDSRYLLTVTARRDGYSAFGSSTDKYGVFPSLAVGWNMQNERFLKDVSFINQLKLRVSYGKSGNQAIDPNQTTTLDASVRYPFNGVSTIGVLASGLGNKKLKWESTTGLNVGIDFIVLKTRIHGTVDAYLTHTNDLLLHRNLPNITGYTWVWDNLGKTQNRGIEVTLNTVNVELNNFSWETNLNLSINRNKIVDLYGDKKSDLGNRWFIGHPINVIYDYKKVGVWQEGEDASNWDPGAKPGDLKFADTNGDHKITADDRIILGHRSPNWIGGMTNTFNYKNVHLSIFIQTFQGAMKNNADFSYADEQGRRNTPGDIGYWTAENKNNDRPALSYTNTRGYGYPMNSSYTRIKDVTLSYIFPQRLLTKMSLGGLTVYASGRNLYTFTKWVGWDMENDYDTRGSGNWVNNYPLVRTIVFGLNVTLK